MFAPLCFGDSADGFIFNYTIPNGTIDFNIRTAAIAAGWNPAIPLMANLIVGVGSVIGASTTATFGFDTGNGYPADSVLTLTNNGYILGRGGNGGVGAYGSYNTDYQPGVGQNGGTALNASYPIQITNNGTIAGGGGGGGGGGQASMDMANNDRAAGGGGGGGAGFNGGAGGIWSRDGEGRDAGVGGVGSTTSGANGGAGTYTDRTTITTSNVIGQDENGYPIYETGWGRFISGGGGRGGNLGAGGSLGGNPYNDLGFSMNIIVSSRYQWSNGAGGGAGGAAVVGNTNITWNTTGTRLGALT